MDPPYIDPTEVVNVLIKIANYVFISYGAGLPLLSDKVQFPSFLRTITSVDIQPYGVVELLLHFGWTWVGMLASDNDYGQEGGHALQVEMAKKGICVEYFYILAPHTPRDRIITIVEMMKKATSTVIILYTFIAETTAVLEEVSLARMPKKTWIAVSSWMPSPVFANKHLWTTLNGTLGLAIGSGEIPGFSSFLTKIHPSKYPSDIFINAFWEEAFGCIWPGNGSTTNAEDPVPGDAPFCLGTEELTSLDSSVYDVTNFRFAYAAYNAVHVVANAMHALLRCKDGQGPFAHGGCTTAQNYQPWQFLHYLKNVSYRNTAGQRIYFDSNGDSPGFFDIVNWRMSVNGISSFSKVGTFATQATGSHKLIINNSTILWGDEYTQAPVSVCSRSCVAGQRILIREGRPKCCYDCVPCPEDEISNHSDAIDCMKCPDDQWPNQNQDLCIPKVVEYLSFHEPLGTTLSSLTALFFLLTASVLCVFTKHRGTPIVKANNRTLSYILLVSILFCFPCSLLFIGRPERVHCWLRQGLFTTFFSFSISCVLAKTITVVIAFRATKPNSSLRKWVGPTIPNSIITICPITQVLMYITWLATYPPFPELNKQAFKGRIVLGCNEGSPYYHYGMKLFLGLLALVTMVVAFLARKLPSGFNEAQHITFSMLVFTSVWLSFIPAYLSTTGKYTAAVEASAILSSSAGLLCCIFATKCYIIILRPEMNTREHLIGKHLPNSMERL
ncbi:extracellular calcium-sensing receptor-like [Lissotriton helveticus]